MSYQSLLLASAVSPSVSQALLQNSMRTPQDRIKEAIAMDLLKCGNRAKNPWLALTLAVGALAVLDPSLVQAGPTQAPALPKTQAPAQPIKVTPSFDAQGNPLKPLDPAFTFTEKKVQPNTDPNFAKFTEQKVQPASEESLKAIPTFRPNKIEPEILPGME